MTVISVILPTYNRAHVITRAIDSVLNQTFHELELIIFDDGSTDNTSEICAKYIDKRTIYIKDKVNRGQAYARNQAILQAKGEYIAFIDSDDSWVLEKCEQQLKFLHERKADLCYTDAIVINENGEKSILASPKMISKSLINSEFNDYQGRNIFVPSVLVKTKSLNKIGLFREDLMALEDLELFTRFIQKFTAVRYPTPLFYYHYANKGNVSTNAEKIKNARLKLLEVYAPEIKNNFNFIAGQYELIAILSGVNGNLRTAINFAFKAINTAKTRPRTWATLIYVTFGILLKKPYQYLKQKYYQWKH